MAAGATAAKLAAMGKTVRFLVAADGRFGSESVDTDPETLAHRRAEEQSASAAVLGVSDVRFLRFSDGGFTIRMSCTRRFTARSYRLDPTLYLRPIRGLKRSAT